MSHQSDQLAPVALIVGCGYLGQRLAERLINCGVEVLGTTRSPSGAAKLGGIGVRPLLLSVTELLTTASLRPAVQAGAIDLFYMVPPGREKAVPRPRQIVIDGMANVLAALRPAHIRRAVLVSSTGVYGQRGGVVVDADTPPEPADGRARMLLEGEALWQRADLPGHILRLAGLYGPGRIIGQSALRERAPLVGDPHSLLNLIHVDDAAELLLAMVRSPQTGRIELGCDNHPVARIDYYRELARRLGVPEPEVLDDQTAAQRLGLDAGRLRRASSKRCDNGPTRRRTGWQPRYPCFREGLDAVLAPAG